jgi:hypothetical protein
LLDLQVIKRQSISLWVKPLVSAGPQFFNVLTEKPKLFVFGDTRSEEFKLLELFLVRLVRPVALPHNIYNVD